MRQKLRISVFLLFTVCIGTVLSEEELESELPQPEALSCADDYCQDDQLAVDDTDGPTFLRTERAKRAVMKGPSHRGGNRMSRPTYTKSRADDSSTGGAPYKKSAYSKCSGPEGLPGTCKPLATCAQYYATPIHYDYNKSNYYKSCTYGYGIHGVCCPDVYYAGKKPSIINYNPRKYGGYDGKYVQVTSEAIQKAVKYATNIQNKFYRNDLSLGRGEDDPSYWGNGVRQDLYLSEVKDYGDAGYFFTLVTGYLNREYGYKPESYYDGGLKLIEHSEYIPAKYRKVCSVFYNKKCYPSKYQSIDGSCNNLKHPFYGQVNTAVGHIRIPKYSDKVWGVKTGYDGSPLPQARYLRTHALPDKNMEEKEINMMMVNYGQFVVHDASHVPFYQAEDGKFLDCCAGYQMGDKQVSPKCYAVPLPQNDQFYKSHKVNCLNLARAMVTPNHYCAAGYASQLNHATSYLDCSLVYGTSHNESSDLRSGKKGYLKSSIVGDQHYLLLDKEAECFNSSDKFCFKSGDLRTTIHPGVTIMQTKALRFHNLCAKKLAAYSHYSDDEKIYQECRKLTIAVFQHITYAEYLPIVLGWRFMYDYGILPPTKGYSYDYDDKVNPWTYAEFTAAAFRLHSSVYGKIALVDEYYKLEKLVKLEHHYNSAILLKTPSNFDKLVRGYIWTAQRKIDQYYDPAVSDLLLKDERHFGLDLATFNIHRGREYGLGSYNDYREICGLPRAKQWKDYYDVIEPEVVDRFAQVYKHPDDLELYPGGVVEKHVQDSVLGPTWWCIAGYQFQSWKRSDRWFYTEGGQPHSFSMDQLDEIRKMSFAALLCMTTGLKQVPAFGFRTISNGNPLVSCSDYEAIPRMSFAPWANYDK